MRQPISARVVADMLQSAGTNRVIALDIHTQQIQGFFGSETPLDFIPGDLVFLDTLKELFHEAPFIVSSTDAGGASRCRDLAAKFNVDIVIVDKRRPRPNVSEVMNVIGDVKGKNVVLYDDICDTGGSLCKAAQALKNAGAQKVYGCVTHAVLSNNAAELISKSCFEKLYFSDSIFIPEEKLKQMGDKVQIISCAPLIAKIINIVHSEESYGEFLSKVKHDVAEELQVKEQ